MVVGTKRFHLFCGSLLVILSLYSTSPVYPAKESRPFWTEKSAFIEGDDLVVVGVASRARTVEEGRRQAFEQGKVELMNYAQITSLEVPGLVIETQMTFEELNDDGTVTVYRLLRVPAKKLVAIQDLQVVKAYGIPQQSDGEITGRDGAPMVLVPAGEFLYGGKNQVNAEPTKRVPLPAFYIDKYEVTTKLYAAFMEATGHSKPKYWGNVKLTSHGELPVIGVGWQDAVAYCHTYGKRLPTEQEWEKAARGTDGRTYPWGNMGPTTFMANYGQSHCGFFCNVYDEKLMPVNSYKRGQSPYGIYNMAGNAWEWVAEEKGIRGGSWSRFHTIGLPSATRATRIWEFGFFDTIGFRCAQDAP